jgi:hypothetical protein
MYSDHLSALSANEGIPNARQEALFAGVATEQSQRQQNQLDGRIDFRHQG